MDQSKIKNLLNLLGLTSLEKEIYLAVVNAGGDELSTLAARMSMSLNQIEPTISSLTKRGIGYFTKSKDRQLFWVVTPEEIERMVKKKEEEMSIVS